MPVHPLCALLGAAPLALASCSPSVARLRVDLDAAASFDEVAAAVRELVAEKGSRGRRALAEFDARRPDFAFDPQSSIAVFFEAPSGILWHEQVEGPTGPSRGGWHLKVPAADVQEIVLGDTARGPRFAVRHAGGAPYPALLCKLEDGKLLAWICLEVDEIAAVPSAPAPPEQR